MKPKNASNVVDITKRQSINSVECRSSAHECIETKFETPTFTHTNAAGTSAAVSPRSTKYSRTRPMFKHARGRAETQRRRVAFRSLSKTVSKK